VRDDDHARRSILRPELEAVMAQAGATFVSMPELEVAAGSESPKCLNCLTGTALVTSGAAAAIQIRTGRNPYRRQRNVHQAVAGPHGTESEVIIQKSHRTRSITSCGPTGVKLIEIETRDQLRQAIGPRTAMITSPTSPTPPVR